MDIDALLALLFIDNIIIIFNATNTWLLDSFKWLFKWNKIKKKSPLARKLSLSWLVVLILNCSWIFLTSFCLLPSVFTLPLAGGWREDFPKSNVALQFRWVFYDLGWWCLNSLLDNLKGFICMLGMEFEGGRKSKLELYECSSIPSSFITWCNPTDNI